MSYSLRGGKEQTAEWFRENEAGIRNVVDIGPGSGTYIDLIKKEYNCCLDSHWTGIEIWKPYIDQFSLEARYNQIINQDVRTIDWKQFDNLSVVIAGDVLEHMTKESAIELVDKVLDVADTMIVSIPIRHMPQGEHAYENPYEEHVKDDWSHDEVMNTWGKYIVKHYRKSVKSKLGVYWFKK